MFCAVVFPFDSFDVQQMHADSSALCPRVLMKDVGNITIAEEERIKLKNLQRQLKNKNLQWSYAVCHPQYEEESVRIGTYENWTLGSWDEQLQSTVMSKAGFYFTGISLLVLLLILLCTNILCFFWVLLLLITQLNV